MRDNFHSNISLFDDSLDEQTQLNLQAAHIVNGRTPDQPFIPYHSIGDVLMTHAMRQPDHLYLIHYDTEGQRTAFTYQQFNKRVQQTAAALATLGIKSGDRVATIAYNHAETVIVYFACWLLGATIAPQNITEDDNRLAYILHQSGAVLALVMPEYLVRAQKLIENAPNIRHLVQIMGLPTDHQVLHLPTLAAQESSPFTVAEAVGSGAECLLVYTSGTTGAPKGVSLTHASVLADAYGISSWQAITSEQRLMNVLPIHHVNGIVVTLLTPLLVGASVVLNRQYQSSVFWKRMADEQVHVVSVVPTLLQFCCEYADAQAIEGKSIWGDGVARTDLRLRHIVCGAGTLSVALATRFEDRFGIPILHGYGLSETTCYSCFLPIDLDPLIHRGWLTEHGYPSIGCPIEPNEMAIFDTEGTGQRMPPGELGEICVRGHNVMRGYDQRPDANRETFKFDWFRSGDQGFYLVDEAGRQFFFISGRIKELINRGGVKFSPFDIEEVLLKVPGVKVGLAIAFENDYYGEEVGAFVVPEAGVVLDADQVIDACRRILRFEKSPKIVIFGTDSEIPITTTGKYQRLKLRDRFSAWKATQFRPASIKKAE